MADAIDIEDFLSAIEDDGRKAVARALDKVPGLLEKEIDGDRPLHYAAWQGAEKVVRLLLDRGADVNARGKHMWTPLHYAVFHSQPAVVRLLLTRRADPDLRDDAALAPVHIAPRRFAPEGPAMADTLLAAGATLDLQAAVRLGRTNDVRRLLAADPVSVHTTPNAADLVSDAVFRLEPALVQVLLDAGANPNVAGKEPHCLVYAMWSFDRRLQLLNLLLDGGADPDFRPFLDCATAREIAVASNDATALTLFARSR